MATALTALANVTLSTTANSITFSSISSAYRDLYFVFTQPAQGNHVRPLIRMNSDSSSADYFEVRAVGNGSSTSSASLSNAGFDPTGFFSSYLDAFQITGHVMDYSATDKHKSVLLRVDGYSQATIMEAGRWANTSAVNTLTFQVAGANPFVAGVSVALYGVSA